VHDFNSLFIALLYINIDSANLSSTEDIPVINSFAEEEEEETYL
jgi:hypothetical protein